VPHLIIIHLVEDYTQGITHSVSKAL